MPLAAFENTFAGGRLDRAAERRRDEAWIAARALDPATRALPLIAGEPLVCEIDGALRLAFVSAEVMRDLPDAQERRLFLGLDGAVATFAFDLDAGSVPGADHLPTAARCVGLRAAAAALPADEAALAATAKAVFEWRRGHGFCARCGARSCASEGGWKRLCPACAAEHFPRTDPVVIMLPVRGERCLLGRQARFPPGLHSALAGFVEPGESIEEACARELQEEAALDTLRTRYHSSQPWPFPHSLMIGLIAEVGESPAHADQVELEAVRWFSRSEARRLAAGEAVDGRAIPPPQAIAHQLIKAWSLG